MSEIIAEIVLDKVIKAIVNPIDESITLLRRIDAKLDAQAKGKLLGSLKTLQNIPTTKRNAEVTLQVVLNSFSESSAYFTALVENNLKQQVQIFSAMRTTALYDAVNPLAIRQMFLLVMKDSLRLGSGPFEKLISSISESINYTTLFILAEIGRIVCMIKLNYPRASINEGFSDIKSHDKPISHDVTTQLLEGEALTPGFLDTIRRAYAESLVSRKLIEETMSQFNLEMKKISLYERMELKFRIPLKKKILGPFVEASLRYIKISRRINDSRTAESLLTLLAREGLL